MKKLILIIAIVLIAIMILFLKIEKGYNVKVKVSFDNLTAFEIDNRIAKNIKDNLMQLSELKEVVVFSKQNTLIIYCKIKPHILNKALVKEEIKSEIYLGLNSEKTITDIEFNNDFEFVYKDFVLIYSDKINHFELKKYSDDTLEKLLSTNITEKILTPTDFKLANYIYFTPEILRQYNINLEDIKNLIKDNNLNNNSGPFLNFKTRQFYSTNGILTDIKDVKDIALYYRNKDFSTKFKDVFKIVEDVKKPIEAIGYYNNYPCQLFALKPKKFYPGIVFKLKLKREIEKLKDIYPDYIKFKLLSKNDFKKLDIFLDDNANIGETLELYNKLKNKTKNGIFIIGGNFVKTKNQNFFDTENPNKLTVLLKNPKEIETFLKQEKINFLKGNENSTELLSNNIKTLTKEINKIKTDKTVNETTKQIEGIYFDINGIYTNEYLINKQEILNSMLASYCGLICDYYYKDTNKIYIILKNRNENEIYVYLKDYKTLLSINSFLKTELKETYQTIARKNGKFFAKLIDSN